LTTVSDPQTEPPALSSWLGLAAAFVAGCCAWLVPLAASVIMYVLSMDGLKVDLTDFIVLIGVVSLLALALPVGTLVAVRWYRPAIAYAVGMVVGVAPLAAFAAVVML